MHVIVKLRGVIIGHAELAVRDTATGLTRGPFRPGLGWELVEPVFLLREEASAVPDALARYERARAALQFELTTGDGRPLPIDQLDIRLERRGAKAVATELVVRSDGPLA